MAFNAEFLSAKHDTTFKLAMRDLRVAREMISAYLPNELVNEIQLNTLAVEKASYIDANLAASHADILYSAQTKSQDDAYIYFLWEHQSTYDKQMPLRLMRYTMNILQDHLKSGHPALPLVFPVVVYNGKQSPYPGSCDFFESFSNPILARKWMLQPFHLIDLSQIPNKELARHPWSALPNLILKHMRARDFLCAVDKYLVPILQYLHQHSGEIIMHDMLQCIIRYTQITDDKALVESINQATPNIGDEVMTLVEHLLARGRVEGHEAGHAAGLQRGREAERMHIINKLLTQGMAASQIAELLEIDVMVIQQAETQIKQTI